MGLAGGDCCTQADQKKNTLHNPDIRVTTIPNAIIPINAVAMIPAFPYIPSVLSFESPVFFPTDDFEMFPNIPTATMIIVQTITNPSALMSSSRVESDNKSFQASSAPLVRSVSESIFPVVGSTAAITGNAIDHANTRPIWSILLNLIILTYGCVDIYSFAVIYVDERKLPQIYNLRKLLNLIGSMITGKIYFRKGKGAYINLSGSEVDELRKSLNTKDNYIVSVEKDGTIILTKPEKSIKT